VIFPERLEHKAATETLSLVFSPPYISFHLYTNFSSAKCHETVGQTGLYPDTRGLLGLWYVDQNLIMVLAWSKVAFAFSLKKHKEESG
jgi:hypothetical protein